MSETTKPFLRSRALLPSATRQPPRRCERVVVTAYRELRAVGCDEMGAFRSCIDLYRIHHPESNLSEARALVSEWIDQHINAATLN